MHLVWNNVTAKLAGKKQLSTITISRVLVNHLTRKYFPMLTVMITMTLNPKLDLTFRILVNT